MSLCSLFTYQRVGRVFGQEEVYKTDESVWKDEGGIKRQFRNGKCEKCRSCHISR